MSDGYNNPAYDQPPAENDPHAHGTPHQPALYQNQPGTAPPPPVPVQMQPGAPGGAGGWMTKPSGFSGCPPGLEYLTQINQLVVKQQIELLEMFTGWEQANKYKISNTLGQQVFFAAEESNACERQCCGPARGFVIHITDNMNQEVIRIKRDFKFCAGCCWFAGADCCAMNVVIEAPVGNVVGHVRQEPSGWSPAFSVSNANNEKIGMIRGPCCIISGPCCPDVEFNILNVPDETTEIGKIAKQWGGIRELVTDADTFSVSFPMDLDVQCKAAFIGAVFLIDFMFFENSQNNNH